MNPHRTQRTEIQRQEVVKQIDESVAAGRTIAQACRSAGINPSSFYDWRDRQNGSAQEPVRQIKTRNVDGERQLKIENQRLKMIVAEQALDIQALKEWAAR